MQSSAPEYEKQFVWFRFDQQCFFYVISGTDQNTSLSDLNVDMQVAGIFKF